MRRRRAAVPRRPRRRRRQRGLRRRRPAAGSARLGPRRAIATALILTALVCCLGLLQKQPCRANAWTSDDIYPELCYSDIAFLYRLRGGVAEGHSPYSSADGAEPLEYPVLTGAMVAAAAAVTSLLDGGRRRRRPQPDVLRHHRA